MGAYLKIAREIAVNLAMGVPPIRWARLKTARTAWVDAEKQARKALDQFEFFRRYIGSYDGKVVAEIGPGDTIGLAPLVIAAGASKYVAIDRFLGDVYGAASNRVYEKLGTSGWQQRVQLCRHSIEEGPPLSADVIVSYNVLEHLSDIRRAFRNMARALSHGGLMVHRIDYGPHDFWADHPDKLAFRKTPNWLWNLMGSNRGYPNRMDHAQVLLALQESGFSTKAHVTEKFEGTPLNAVLVSRLEDCT
jgi:SAM-dependent methyltransferase